MTHHSTQQWTASSGGGDDSVYAVMSQMDLNRKLLILDQFISNDFSRFLEFSDTSGSISEGDRKQFVDSGLLPAFDSRVSKSIAQVAVDLSSKLDISLILSIQIVEYSSLRRGEFGSSLLDTSIVMYYSYRRLILKCILEVLLIAFDGDLPETLAAVANDYVQKWLAGLLPRVFHLFGSMRLDILSLLIEDRLNVSSAVGNAREQNLSLPDAIAKLISRQTTSITAAMGVRINEERNCLARILGLLCWNCQLSSGDILSLINFIQSLDYDEPLLSVLIASFFAQIDICCESVLAQVGSRSLRPNSDAAIVAFRQVYFECDKVLQSEWVDKQARASALFLWILLVRRVGDKVASFEKEFGLTQSKCEEVVEDCIGEDALPFIRSRLIPFSSADDATVSSVSTACGLFYQQDDYLKELVLFVLNKAVLYISSKMTDVLRRLKMRDEDIPTSRQTHRSYLHESTKSLRGRSEHDLTKVKKQEVGSFFDLVAAVYAGREHLSLQLLDSKRSFIKTIYDERLSASAKKSYFHMIAALSSGPQSAQIVYDLLSGFSSALSWEWVFKGLQWYTEMLQQSAEKGSPMEILPEDLVLLQSILRLIENIARNSASARISLFDSMQATRYLFLMLASRVPKELKAALLDSIRAFCYSDQMANIGFNIPWQIWNGLEAVQILSPHANAAAGITHDLKTVEAKDEAYPETMAFLRLIDALLFPFTGNFIADDGRAVKYRYSLSVSFRSMEAETVPKSTIMGSKIAVPEPLVNFGVNGEKPILTKYVDFVVDEVICKIGDRPHSSSEERTSILKMALAVVEKCLLEYDPAAMLKQTALSRDNAMPPSGSKESIGRAIVSHPGFGVMMRMVGSHALLETLLKLLHDHSSLMTSSYVVSDSCIDMVSSIFRILCKVADIQDVFIRKVVSAVRESIDKAVVSQVDIRAVSPVESVVLQSPDLAVSLVTYVNCVKSDEISLLSVVFCSHLVRSHHNEGRGTDTAVGRSSGMAGNRFVQILQSSDRLNEVISGYYSRIEKASIPGSTAVSETAREIRLEIVAGESGLESEVIPLAVLELFLTDITFNQVSPGFSHLVLGFDCTAPDRTEFKKIHSLDESSAKPVLYGLVELLRESLQRLSEISLQSPAAFEAAGSMNELDLPLFATNPLFFERLLELVYILCSDRRTSQPVMHYLRYGVDLFHSAAREIFNFVRLPLGVPRDSGPEYRSSHLQQSAFLLKIITLEIHSGALLKESRHGKSLLPYLLGCAVADNGDGGVVDLTDAPSVLSLLTLVASIDSGASDSSLSGVVQIFHNFSFDEFLRVDSEECSYYDIPAMHDAMQYYLRSMEATGNIRSPHLIREANAEIMSLLSFFERKNEVDYLLFAKSHCLGACKEVIEICLVNLLEYASPSSRFKVLYRCMTNVIEILITGRGIDRDLMCLASLLVRCYGCVSGRANRTNVALEQKTSLQDRSLFLEQSAEQSAQLLARLVTVVMQSASRATIRSDICGCIILHIHELIRIGDDSHLNAAWLSICRYLDRLYSLILDDCARSGLDIWKTLSFSAMSSLVLLQLHCSEESIQKDSFLLKHMRQRNFFRHFVQEIQDVDDVNISTVFESLGQPMTAIYIFEAKMTFLRELAAIPGCASAFIDSGAIEVISNLKCLHWIDSSQHTLTDRGEDAHSVSLSCFKFLSTLLASGRLHSRELSIKGIDAIRSQSLAVKTGLRSFNDVVSLKRLERIKSLVELFVIVGHELYTLHADERREWDSLLVGLLDWLSESRRWIGKLDFVELVEGSMVDVPSHYLLVGERQYQSSSNSEDSIIFQASISVNMILRNVLQVLCLQPGKPATTAVRFEPVFSANFLSVSSPESFERKRNGSLPSLGCLVRIVKSSQAYMQMVGPRLQRQDVVFPILESALYILKLHIVHYLNQSDQLNSGFLKERDGAPSTPFVVDQARFVGDGIIALSASLSEMASMNSEVSSSKLRGRMNFIKAMCRDISHILSQHSDTPVVSRQSSDELMR